MFGAIQEVVRILDADPKTDWSTVDLDTIRQDLIDMNEVPLGADLTAEPPTTIPSGVRHHC
jgi:hypothetical protein